MTQGAQGEADAAQRPDGQPSEAERQAAYEAELSRVTAADMVLQATVTLLNIGARRLGLVGEGDPGAEQAGPERDLEQVRDAIDAVRGLLPVVERRAAQEARPLRDALAQLQMAYARAAQATPTPQEPAQAPQQSAPASTPPQPQQGPPGSRGPGPAESSGRLWVPGR